MTDPEAEPERQFLDLAEGSSGLAKILYASLERLRDGAAGADLQEMARDVLAGHTDLRQIAATDAYGPMLLDQFHRFKEWEKSLDPDERRRLADEATAVAHNIDRTTD
ncbi:hypothetical protein O7598_26555 [Micromonospora sp. WMMC241]|uniref:hypothetical protein n=1 Tax=Micromonospora sp. WMMC241 TaxID=3015159 RepID=UPI0022B6374F|nr:hypothetical protein [Micromonospora sp. WMMC241]MCZ7439990.1 hypothetical protein [Micromonospora sp. WMMC241]